jgi:hydroxyacylglutathione hydrolase/adenylyltransferase/sulfurtransferase
VADDSPPETNLDPERFAELVAAGGRLIDVRRPYEFEGSRLAGAENIEMNELTAVAESIERARPVLFYCRSGNRSGMAAEAFRQAGYDAYHLAGGIEAWGAAGRPVEPQDGGVRAPLPAS